MGRESLLERLQRDLAGEVAADSVMVANARTAGAFSARIVGRFEPVGANSWDASTFHAEEGAVVRIFPGVKVQAEDALGWFRMRYRGGASMFEWQPAGALPPAPEALHRAFVETCLTGHSNPRGLGARGVIARKPGE